MAGKHACECLACGAGVEDPAGRRLLARGGWTAVAACNARHAQAVRRVAHRRLAADKLLQFSRRYGYALGAARPAGEPPFFSGG